MSLTRRYSLEDLQEHAEYLDAVLLTDKYEGYKAHYKWMCGMQHIFILSYDDVRAGRWCKKCSTVDKKEKLNFIKSLAEKFGGECISNKYENKDAKLTFRCEKHGIFEQSARKLIARYWCKLCDVRYGSFLTELHTAAKKKGGQCLDTIYKGSKANYSWRCDNKSHSVWQAPARNILNGSWCKECKYELQANQMIKSSKHSINELVEVALLRKGRLIDGFYKGMRHKYTWECDQKHQWQASAENVVNNLSWCPYCNSNNITEAVCRTILEQLLRCDLPRAYPVWLKNESNSQLELDGYNEERAIAFEYQGSHHYEVGYRCDEKKLETNIKNDAIKRNLCREKGVNLLIIDRINQKSIKKITEIIKELCKKEKLEVCDTDISINNALLPRMKTELARIKQIAIERNGMVISNEYIGNLSPMSFQCSQGHLFSITPKNLKKGNWCQDCAGVLKKTIEWCHELAFEKDGYCLSDIYKNNREKMIWKCKFNEHPPWQAPACRIAQGHWCPLCGNTRKGYKNSI